MYSKNIQTQFKKHLLKKNSYKKVVALFSQRAKG